MKHIDEFQSFSQKQKDFSILIWWRCTVEQAATGFSTRLEALLRIQRMCILIQGFLTMVIFLGSYDQIIVHKYKY